MIRPLKLVAALFILWLLPGCGLIDFLSEPWTGETIQAAGGAVAAIPGAQPVGAIVVASGLAIQILGSLFRRGKHGRR